MSKYHILITKREIVQSPVFFWDGSKWWLLDVTYLLMSYFMGMGPPIYKKGTVEIT